MEIGINRGASLAASCMEFCRQLGGEFAFSLSIEDFNFSLDTRRNGSRALGNRVRVSPSRRRRDEERRRSYWARKEGSPPLDGRAVPSKSQGSWAQVAVRGQVCEEEKMRREEQKKQLEEEKKVARERRMMEEKNRKEEEKRMEGIEVQKEGEPCLTVGHVKVSNLTNFDGKEFEALRGLRIGMSGLFKPRGWVNGDGVMHYEDRKDAARAIEAMDGFQRDHPGGAVALRVRWAEPGEYCTFCQNRVGT